jgi:uroporphyrinogen decarboxylase
VSAHLAYQVECGAQAVVLFDTWAGQLTPADYRRHAAPYSARSLTGTAGRVPRMAFVRDGLHLLDDVVELGVEAMALDWRVPLGAAFERYGDRVALQGNLDPAVLLATPDEVTRRTEELLDVVAGRPGHILALGHGVMKQTDPECVAAFVAAARGQGAGA